MKFTFQRKEDGRKGLWNDYTNFVNLRIRKF